MRREYPEPLIALLSFILGIWLWDHYFGKSQGYPPGTEEVALVKIDRDLRVADSMAAAPGWLRWIASVDPPATTRADSLNALAKLARDESMTLSGLEAFAVITANHTHRPIPEVLAQVAQGQIPPDLVEAADLLQAGKGKWWHARLVESASNSLPDAQVALASFNAQSEQLRWRVVATRSAVWLIGLAGLCFLPLTLRDLSSGFRKRPSGYGGAWTIPLGSVVFLVATLAWIGFTLTLELGISALPGLHPAIGILLDSAARLMPALIAIGLLFRKPSHAARVMGINKEFPVAIILGLFATLMIIDQMLRNTLGKGINSEPGGGLSSGEVGWWGLVFAVSSACVLAPVAEEIVYRGVLFRSFWNRIGLIPAAVLSSLVFAVLHFYNGYGLASVAVFGFSCAFLYAATGSLGAAIALHALYNSSIKIPEWIIYHAPLS